MSSNDKKEPKEHKWLPPFFKDIGRKTGSGSSSTGTPSRSKLRPRIFGLSSSLPANSQSTTDFDGIEKTKAYSSIPETTTPHHDTTPYTGARPKVRKSPDATTSSQMVQHITIQRIFNVFLPFAPICIVFSHPLAYVGFVCRPCWSMNAYVIYNRARLWVLIATRLFAHHRQRFFFR